MWGIFNKKHNEEYIIEVASCSSWIEKEKWACLLNNFHLFFDESRLKLDTEDPLLRASGATNENASFIVDSIVSGEDAIFGEFSMNSAFTIEGANSEDFYSRIALYVSHLNPKYSIFDVLECIVTHLDAFYGYADTVVNHSAWKKKRVIWGIDYRRELPGIMWHTYFNMKYVKYFGIDKIEQFSSKWMPQGVIISLKFNSVRQRLKMGDFAAKVFGEKSFVDHRRITPQQKKNGEYVLDMKEIRSQDGSNNSQ